jgi:hypothetical protein
MRPGTSKEVPATSLKSTPALGNFFEVHQRRTYNLIERRDSPAALRYR